MFAKRAPLFILSKQSIASRAQKAMQERYRRKKKKDSKQEGASMPPLPRLQQAVRNTPPQTGCALIRKPSLAMECLPTLECGRVEMRDSRGHEGKEREDIGYENGFRLVTNGVITNGVFHADKSGKDQESFHCKEMSTC